MNSIDLDAQFLPSRFLREERIRFGRPGTAQAKISTQYVDQKTGQVFKTKGQLQTFLGNRTDLSVFDFKTGKLSPNLLRKKLTKTNLQQTQPFKVNIKPPVRQLALPRQKVNVLKNQPSRVNPECKAETLNPEKPRQVFWEKRLSIYKTADESVTLPKNIKPFGPEVDATTAVRSIAAALQLHSNLGIVGQTDSKAADKNSSTFINPSQPLVHALMITEDDVRKQEERVLNARRKLTTAFKEDLVV